MKNTLLTMTFILSVRDLEMPLSFRGLSMLCDGWYFYMWHTLTGPSHLIKVRVFAAKM